jgi:hypothetical protein
VIGKIALAVFVLSCSAVGLRLVWIGARRNIGPAWSCGLGFTFIALVGQPLQAASGSYTGTVGEINHAFAAAGILFVAAGLSSFYAFTLTVFRMQARWAWVLTCAAILALTICGFGRIGALASADRALRAVAVGAPWAKGIGTLSMICYAWLGFEGILEWSKSRKRLALGLADPVVSNRFLMWGLFGTSTAILSGFLLFLQITTVAGSQTLAGQLATAGFGLVSATTVMLAFFPPERYVAWVRARAGALSAGAHSASAA